MSGWISKDENKIRWDGTIEANGFEGDGSKLTGIAGGGGTNLWASNAKVIYPIATNQSISGTGIIASTTVSGVNISGTGYVSGALLYGDGSNLTGITAGGGVNLWASNAKVIYPIARNQAISGAGLITSTTVSGVNVSATGYLSGALVYGDGQYLTNLPAGTESDPIWVAASSALYANVATVSGATITNAADIATVSGANVETQSELNTVSGTLIQASGVIVAHESELNTVSGTLIQTSGSLISHAADTSDPHGATLTQTNFKLTSGSIQSDHTALSGAMIRNVVFGTGSTPPTASNFTQGTIYLQYTP